MRHAALVPALALLAAGLVIPSALAARSVSRNGPGFALLIQTGLPGCVSWV